LTRIDGDNSFLVKTFIACHSSSNFVRSTQIKKLSPHPDINSFIDHLLNAHASLNQMDGVSTDAQILASTLYVDGQLNPNAIKLNIENALEDAKMILKVMSETQNQVSTEDRRYRLNIV